MAVWGLLGYGLGELSLAADSEDTATEISLTMGAFGGRGELVSPGKNGRYALAVKSDGVLARMDSETAGRLPAATADVHRLRLLLEGSFAALRGPSGVLTPSLEVGARYDGGAAETGAGLEVGGGLRYAYPAWGG